MKVDSSASSMRTIGSLTLCRSLLKVGHVDRFRVVVFPVITGSTGQDRIYDGYPDVALEMINSRSFDGRIQLLEYVPSVLSGPPLDRHGKRSQQFHVNVGRASARTGITNRKAADCRACRSMMLAGYSPLMLVAGDDPLAVAATRAVQGGDLEALRELLTALSILALRTPRLVTTIRVACADRCFTQLPTGPVTTQTTSSWWSC